MATQDECEYKRPPLTLPQQIMVGTLSGWTEILMCQPIDTYKTGLQSVNRVGFSQFFSMGVTHWYAGTAPMLVFRAVYISALKVGNESYKNFMCGRGVDTSTSAQMMSAGAVAGIIATPVSCVSEWFKTQMQNNGLSLRSLLANRSTIRRSFNGLLPTVMREAGYGATLFGLNPIYHRNLKEALPDWNPHLIYVIAGITAGITGGLLTQPFDTVKTLYQERKEGQARVPIARLIATRYQQGGLRSFWAGAVPRAARLAIGTTVLDRCITYFDEYFISKNDAAQLESRQVEAKVGLDLGAPIQAPAS